MIKTSPNLPDPGDNSAFIEIQEENDDKTIANSIEFNSINVRMNEFEQLQNNNLREVCANLEKKMDQN